jgi:serine/threonine protein kinase
MAMMLSEGYADCANMRTEMGKRQLINEILSEDKVSYLKREREYDDNDFPVLKRWRTVERGDGVTSQGGKDVWPFSSVTGEHFPLQNLPSIEVGGGIGVNAWNYRFMSNGCSGAFIPKKGDFSDSESESYSESDDEEYPERIGDYIIIKKLKKGSYAKVFLAQSLSGEKVVIRLNDKTFKSKNDYFRYVAALNILRHENIVKMIEYFETDRFNVIVMEYLDMITLDTLRERNILKQSEIFLIFRQLVVALEYMTINGVSHRDIKPDNIMINPTDLTVKIIDFGLSCLLKNDPFPERVGTLMYMAPEIFSGKLYEPWRVDIWGLGVIFHELIFNEMPYTEPESIDEIEEMWRVILEKEIYRMKFEDLKIPESIKILCRSMLSTDPSKRVNHQELLVLISDISGEIYNY